MNRRLLGDYRSLETDQKVWKKQRHIAARIYYRLVDEYSFSGG
jgi:hypothetical protein